MGKNNQQRRAAKAKQRHHRGPTTRSGPRPPIEDVFGGWDHEQRRRDEAFEVLQTWRRTAASASIDGLRWQIAREVDRRRPEVLTLVEELLVGELITRVAGVWEAGWEPRDLAHAASKNPRVEMQVVALIGAQARASGAAARAPQRWLDQWTELGVDLSRPEVPWRPVTGAGDQQQTWLEVLLALKLVAELMPLQRVGPPPSQWGRRAAAAPTASTTSRDRLLNSIRALLAKAEATEYAAEAETFTAKAQELMTRHAVDEAVLRDEQHEQVPVETRRVHLQAPYATVKSRLLAAVARSNRCRSVLISQHDIAVLVGTPLDVDHSELLFTSLLIQATRAMADAGHRRAGSFDRSATFRRSFLTAYAARIGERLEEADRSTTASYGAALVPMLQREADAVSAEFERQFPHLKKIGSGYLDPRGWAAGRAAADRAALIAGQIPA